MSIIKRPEFENSAVVYSYNMGDEWEMLEELGVLLGEACWDESSLPRVAENVATHNLGNVYRIRISVERVK